MKVITLIAMLLIAPDLVPSATAGCIVEHLKEAIKINKERKELYGALTQGESRKISRRLILFEKASLPVAYYLDRKAKKYQRRGINLFCNEMISMDLTPPFRSLETVPSHSYLKISASRMKRVIKEAYKIGGLLAVQDETAKILHQLESVPAYHCMVRHFIESIHLLAQNGPRYDLDYERWIGGSSYPSRLIWKFIKLHLRSLSLMDKLDRQAAPFQQRGLPILCQDIPPIADYFSQPSP